MDTRTLCSRIKYVEHSLINAANEARSSIKSSRKEDEENCLNTVTLVLPLILTFKYIVVIYIGCQPVTI
ncbi:hypothetical protein NQ318_000900 [Aromia moschata]|uniref:Uncharacterized protein n=1 Tax=Aromia moschata TaxID=1265417 RepID=A0AAV8ZEY1_9CUCU|nr:hypothetical protein NQ318_000900 [Aromia moschata]